MVLTKRYPVAWILVLGVVFGASILRLGWILVLWSCGRLGAKGVVLPSAYSTSREISPLTLALRKELALSPLFLLEKLAAPYPLSQKNLEHRQILNAIMLLCLIIPLSVTGPSTKVGAGAKFALFLDQYAYIVWCGVVAIKRGMWRGTGDRKYDDVVVEVKGDL